MRRAFVAGAASVLCLAGAAADDDLDRIPAMTPQAAAPALQTPQAVYLQGDLALGASRKNLAVQLAPPPSWEARLFLDTRLSWDIGSIVLAYSGRLNLRAEDGLPFPSRETIRNDLREAYAGWQDAGGLSVELGRINLKSGVALGFNPTDFFRTRAVVEPVSADPTVLREDRLGAAMLLAQQVWAGGSVTLALAPKLAGDTPPYANDALPSFDPMFDRTNARGRALLKASVDVFDLSPEVSIYEENGRTQFGLNVTDGIGAATVVYLEWAGGARASLAEAAFADGVRTGVLPPAPVLPVSAARGFRNDVAAGVSYTVPPGITVTLEYDRHDAGFSGDDWRNWFGIGAANPSAAGPLWFIRGYASDRQEPVARDSLFVRFDWPDAIVRDLHLTGFVDSDLRDGSGLAQFAADYYVSPEWTVGGLVDLDIGGRHTDFGSLPQTATMLFKVSRYF
ncbi:MAG TPA: hypothetical protein VG387_05550 [Rhizomicrobium sp.]|jgi:hypothetical protein|nr:hypothetical protein [Rhizomicrobium sp.]